MSLGVRDRPGESAANYAVVVGLEARGAVLAGVVNTAVAGLVGVISEALASGAGVGSGITSPQQWAALRFGLSPYRAQRLVAAAEALAGLPAVRAAFGAGEIGEDHVAAIVRAGVTAVHDAQAAELARHASVSQLQRGLSFLPQPPKTEPDDPAGEPPPRRRGREPSVSSGFGDDGMHELRSVLDAADGAVVDKALDAARTQLWRARFGEGADRGLRQRVTGVEALRHLAQVGLDAMDPNTRGGAGRMPSERYVVNLHVDAEHPDGGRIHLGPALPAQVRRELGCDGLVRLWLTDRLGKVGLGRIQRVVDAKQRTVVEDRDRGCRVPGCGRTRWLYVHHIVHWEHGGPTETWNLVALCRDHHAGVHRGVFSIHGDADRLLEFRDPKGRPVGPAPPRPPGAPPGDAARACGLPEPGWVNRPGERAQWDCMVWNEHPPPGPSPN